MSYPQLIFNHSSRSAGGESVAGMDFPSARFENSDIEIWAFLGQRFFRVNDQTE